MQPHTRSAPSTDVAQSDRLQATARRWLQAGQMCIPMRLLHLVVMSDRSSSNWRRQGNLSVRTALVSHSVHCYAPSASCTDVLTSDRSKTMALTGNSVRQNSIDLTSFARPCALCPLNRCSLLSQEQAAGRAGDSKGNAGPAPSRVTRAQASRSRASNAAAEVQISVCASA